MTAPDRAHASRRRRTAGRTSDPPFGRRAARRRLRFALIVATAGVFTTLLAVDLWNLRDELLPGRAAQTGILVRDNPQAQGNVAAEVSGVEAPATYAPDAEERVTDEPVTEASVTEASATAAPLTAAPLAAAPVVEAPTKAADSAHVAPAAAPTLGDAAKPAALPKLAPPSRPARDPRTDAAAVRPPDAAPVPGKLAPVRFVIPQPGSRLEFTPSGELSERLVQAARRGERIVIRGRVGHVEAAAGEQDAAVRAERARRFLIVRGVPAERIWIGASMRAGDGDRALIIDVSTRGEVSDDAVLATAPTRGLASPGLSADGPRE